MLNAPTVAVKGQAIDSGANGLAFIDSSLAQKHGMDIQKFKQPRNLCVIDGQKARQPLTHYTTSTLTINGHQETITLFVTKLGRYPIVLGLPWLKKHLPLIDWARDSLMFVSKHCRGHCL